MSGQSYLLPSLLIIVGSSTAFAVDDFGLQLHGFASQGYVRTDGQLYENTGLWGRDTNSGTFELNEFAVNITATPVDRLRIGAQFIAYDIGKYGNDEVQIDWAFGQYQVPTDINWLDVNFVAGRFKTGHGLYNDFRDLDMTRTPVFLPRATYSASFRDFFLAANGAQINSSLRSDSFGSLDLSGYVGTQNIDGSDGPIFDTFKNGIAQAAPTIPGVGTLTMKLTSADSITLERMSGGYATWNTPVNGLRLKVSNLYVHDMRLNGGVLDVTMPVNPGLGAASGTTARTSLDIYIHHWTDIMTGFEYQKGDFTFAGEYTNQYWKATTDTGALDFVGTGFPGPFPPASVDQPASTRMLTARANQFYGSVNYQLTTMPGFLSNVHVFGAYNWSQSRFDNSTSYTKSVVFAVRYDVTDHFLLKGEFERIQETTSANQHIYGNIFSLKTTFDF